MLRFDGIGLAAAFCLVAAMGMAGASRARAEMPQMPVSRDAPPPRVKAWASCEEAGEKQEIEVLVRGVRSAEGRIRVQLYDGDPDHFLAKGWKLYRGEADAVEGEAKLCVPVPAPGEYAIVVMHDENANGKFEAFSEGYGFSRNPSTFFGRPRHEEVAFEVEEGVTRIAVDLKYVFSAVKTRPRRAGRR